MPSVPYNPTRTVLPDAASAIPYQTDRGVSSDAFGAQVGAAQQTLGKEIDRFGDMLAKHSLEMQKLQNQANADNRTSNYLIEQGKLDTEFRSKEGKAQADSLPEYIDRSKALRDQFSEGAENPEERRLFDSETRRYFAGSVRSAAFSSAAEMKKYITKANLRLGETAASTVLSNPSDEGFSEAVALGKRAVTQEAANKGWTEEETKNKLDEMQSHLVNVRVGVLAEKDPEKAVELFEKSKGLLVPDDLREVETKLATAKQKAGTQAAILATGMKRAVESDINSIAASGKGVDGLRKEKVAAVLGKQVAEDWVDQRTDAYTVWWHTHDAATLPVSRMEKQLENLIPKPGSANFDRESAIYKQVYDKFATRLAQRQQDPAASVSDDPVVKAVDINDRGALVEARIAAQTRAGILPAQQSPITVSEALELTAPMTRMLPGSEPEIITGVAKRFKELYGDQWQQAFGFALKAQKLDAAKITTATAVMQRIVGEVAPSGAEQAPSPESTAAQKATEPLSRRLLDKLPKQKRSDLFPTDISASKKQLPRMFDPTDDEPPLIELSSEAMEDIIKKIPAERILEVIDSPTDAVVENFDDEFGDGLAGYVILNEERFRGGRFGGEHGKE